MIPCEIFRVYAVRFMSILTVVKRELAQPGFISILGPVLYDAYVFANGSSGH